MYSNVVLALAAVAAAQVSNGTQSTTTSVAGPQSPSYYDPNFPHGFTAFPSTPAAEPLPSSSNSTDNGPQSPSWYDPNWPHTLSNIPSTPAAEPLPTGNVTETEIVTYYTTYCPSPTTFAHGDKTYTVTAPTTLTLTNPAPAKPTAPAPAKPSTAGPAPAKPTTASPVAPANGAAVLAVGALPIVAAVAALL